MTTELAAPQSPAGASWVGDWHAQYADRHYQFPAVEVGEVAVFLTGAQERDGRTASSIGLRFNDRPPLALDYDSTLAQAPQLARAPYGFSTRLHSLAANIPSKGNRGWNPCGA